MTLGLDLAALALGAAGCVIALIACNRAARRRYDAHCERLRGDNWRARAADLSIEKVQAARRRSAAGKTARQAQLDEAARRRANVIDALRNGTPVQS